MGVVKITKMQKPKYTYIFNKQPGYKQLALKRKLAKQFSGLKSLSVSNNKNHRLKKVKFFLCVINIKQLLGQQYTKIQLPQKHYWKSFNMWVDNYQFTFLQI